MAKRKALSVVRRPRPQPKSGKRSGFKPHLHAIPQRYLDAANSGIENTLQWLRLTQTPSLRNTIGNRPLKDNSKRTYEKHFRGLRHFCSIIGDYESLLMLNGPLGKTPTPPFVPSMSSRTLFLYISYKRLEQGRTLCDESGSPVNSIFGNQVQCVGGWNDPNQVQQLLSGVVALHAASGETGTGRYEEKCLSCIQKCQNGDSVGCGFPHIVPCI